MAATFFSTVLFFVLFVWTLPDHRNTSDYYCLRGYSAQQRVLVKNIWPDKSRFSNSPSRSISIWNKRGHICLSRPFTPDLSVAMDVERNPGPNSTLRGCALNVQRQLASATIPKASNNRATGSQHANLAGTPRSVYTRNELYDLRGSHPTPWTAPSGNFHRCPAKSEISTWTYRRSRAGRKKNNGELSTFRSSPREGHVFARPSQCPGTITIELPSSVNRYYHPVQCLTGPKSWISPS